jgi:hypothetical protein
MPLIRNLIKKWGNRKAVNVQANHPENPLARESIQKVWINNEISNDFSKEFIDDIASQMMKEVMEILSSPNPFLLNRIRLAASVVDLAEYQVLVMEPAPSPDLTGLRDSEVTGELKARLDKLSTLKNHLRIWTGNDASKVSGYEDLFSLVLDRYKVCWAWSELFHSLSLALEVNHQDQPDWYKPFIHSMCASKEHHFRLDLKMPSVLDSDSARASLIASEHSLFFNLVRHGLEDPLEAWKAIVDHIEYEDDKLAVYNMYATEYHI